jgi:cobalt-zinc-cadmium efflux system outer membrane protein
MKISSIRFGLALALLAPTTARRLVAEPVPNGGFPSELSLEESIQQALLHNSDFRVAALQVDAALAQLKIAREYPNPTLGLSTAKVSTDGTPEGTVLGNGLFDRAYDSIASLSQLFLVGKRGLMRDAATAGVHAAEFQRDDARRLLILAVTQDYSAALAAREEADVLVASAAKLRREAEIGQHRFEAGDVSASDRNRLEIAAEQDELGAEAERAIAKAAVVALETILGLAKPNGSTALSDSLGRLLERTPPDLEMAAIQSRPDLDAAVESLKQAEANVTLQRRQRIPDVTASIQYERNPPISVPGQTNTVGIGLSFPLPIWNQYNGEILAAQSARAQSEAQLDKVRIQVSADIAAARVAFHEASERARRYKASLVPKSAAATQSVSYAYSKGGASLVDLLEAERDDNAIRVAAVQSEADSVAAGVALLSALGRISNGAAQ